MYSYMRVPITRRGGSASPSVNVQWMVLLRIRVADRKYSRVAAARLFELGGVARAVTVRCQHPPTHPALSRPNDRAAPRHHPPRRPLPPLPAPLNRHHPPPPAPGTQHEPADGDGGDHAAAQVQLVILAGESGEWELAVAQGDGEWESESEESEEEDGVWDWGNFGGVEGVGGDGDEEVGGWDEKEDGVDSGTSTALIPDGAPMSAISPRPAHLHLHLPQHARALSLDASAEMSIDSPTSSQYLLVPPSFRFPSDPSPASGSSYYADGRRSDPFPVVVANYESGVVDGGGEGCEESDEEGAADGAGGEYGDCDAVWGEERVLPSYALNPSESRLYNAPH
ncbi:hypothetical protein B0H34DRAFT_810440 [Crassisporium funariophilum]|nr:hypothetical protein B0H34DRAFT_810440 [Crassisporium funariophilum]